VGLASRTTRLAANQKQNPQGVREISDDAFKALVALDDPRRDPITLALLKSALGRGAWGGHYADVVRAFGNAYRVGHQSGAALASLERGEVEIAPAIEAEVREGDSVAFTPSTGVLIEGVAVLRRSVSPELASRFMQFLEEQRRAEVPTQDERDESEGDLLLAELLGAAVVDAREEIGPALEALKRTNRPELAERWLVPPPWPPASVQKLRKTDPSGALMEALAEQVAPDLDIRFWLLESWQGPNRPLDGKVLRALAGAVDGKLVAEPRFRAWVRAEWTAWARQCYRRIVRQSEMPLT
jgi:hypothetical protein